MGEILSQEEIDELLKSLASGNDVGDDSAQSDDKNKVKNYDFRTANKFAKEQIRTLHIIYENFARLLSSYLTGTLRMQCEIDVISVEEQTYQEFTNSLPTPVVLGIVNLNPLRGQTILELSPVVAYALINRLLGGTTSNVESSRNFTEIELVIIERILRQILKMLEDSWSKVVVIEPTLERVETSSQFAQIVSYNETIAIITLNIQIGEAEGLLNICIPHMVLEPVAKQLNIKFWFSSKDNSKVAEPATDRIYSKLNTTLLPLTATFTDTTATVREILGLQVGDVLQLDHRVDEDIEVKIAHIPKFHGQLGVKDGRYAVKITHISRSEEESYNE